MRHYAADGVVKGKNNRKSVTEWRVKMKATALSMVYVEL